MHARTPVAARCPRAWMHAATMPISAAVRSAGLPRSLADVRSSRIKTSGGTVSTGAAAATRPAMHADTASAPATALRPISSPASVLTCVARTRQSHRQHVSLVSNASLEHVHTRVGA